MGDLLLIYGMVLFVVDDTIRHLYLALSLCVVISHIIGSVVISLMYSQVTQRQV